MSRRLASVLTAASAALLLAIAASPANAAFGLKGFDVTFTAANGSSALEAGTHPFALSTAFGVETTPGPVGEAIPDEEVKDLLVEQAVGLVGDPLATPRCSTLDFLKPDPVNERGSSCPDSTSVGTVAVEALSPGTHLTASVHNLVPPPGVAAKIGFAALQVPVTVELGVKPTPPYNIVANVSNIPQPQPFFGSVLTLWGNPASAAHDPYRGICVGPGYDESALRYEDGFKSLGSCPTNIPEKPFITLPRRCEGPLRTSYEARSWQDPAGPVFGFSDSHDDSIPPGPRSTGDCDKVLFEPDIAAQTTNLSASGPTGLDFDLSFDNEGLVNPTGTADSEIKKAVVKLPEGVTINPSAAEGLAVCSVGDFEEESAASAPPVGCPPASKVGTVQVETPLLEETLEGEVFVATPYENPFGTLLAIYMTVKSPERGVGVRLAGKVEPNPVTGQLETTFGEPGHEIPQFPFSHFHFHFREGGRSPLITPPTCGTYETEAILTPWANPSEPLQTAAPFQITQGVGGGSCPPAGPLPFAPGFSAGTLNNSAGEHSPFVMRLTRADGEQDMTRFSAVLPRGVVGKLAGISQCSEAAIAGAKVKTGRQELASPSCPPGSEIGDTLAGAGVGSQLAYVPGKLYLAGPFGGDPLSVVAITPAVAGPFDVGTVVVREALTLDPVTAEVEADGSHSDPIPHLLAGIPLKLRDLRVSVDRDKFILNPTSCDPFQTKATLFGGGGFLDPGDDSPISLADRFQAADCAALGFKPSLSLRLKGGTKRGGHPALRAVLRPRPGDANLKSTVVRLPRSAFLDQAHIRTICTRVQFAADACPKGAVYGHVTVSTPLLDEPLKGPAYLRSSDNLLPDLVFDLKGIVDIEASARIDSIEGGIRATFGFVPDAPVSKVVVDMQGGAKGLIVNSRNLCLRGSRAAVQLGAHNNRRLTLRPAVKADCGKKRKRGGSRTG